MAVSYQVHAIEIWVIPGDYVGFVVDTVALGRPFSPFQYHSTHASCLSLTWIWFSTPIWGHSKKRLSVTPCRIQKISAY